MTHGQKNIKLDKNKFMYRVIQEERSIFSEVKISVIVRKEVHMTVCLILNGYWDGAVF